MFKVPNKSIERIDVLNAGLIEFQINITSKTTTSIKMSIWHIQTNNWHYNLIFLFLTLSKWLPIAEAYAEPCKTSKMEFSAKIVNGIQPLTIFAKSSVLEVWQGSEYDSELEVIYFHSSKIYTTFQIPIQIPVQHEQ